MGKADLHVHTTASDGELIPEEAVRWAGIKRLSTIAITDHDTVNGLEAAISAGEQHHVEIVPGIELSTSFEEDEVHILGYYIDYKEKWFLSELETMQNSRHGRAYKMIEKLKGLGFDISLEQVERIADTGIIGRPHIARAMIKKGYIESTKDAFSKYIGKGCPAYVERYKLSSEEAVRMIDRLGGVPVLAHPGLIKNKAVIGKVLDLGIRGIEVYHTKHGDEDIRQALQIAKARNLIITGGSDCHGSFFNNEPIMGNVFVDDQVVIELKDLALNIRKDNRRGKHEY